MRSNQESPPTPRTRPRPSRSLAGLGMAPFDSSLVNVASRAWPRQVFCDRIQLAVRQFDAIVRRHIPDSDPHNAPDVIRAQVRAILKKRLVLSEAPAQHECARAARQMTIAAAVMKKL